jgi:hypothetical protein
MKNKLIITAMLLWLPLVIFSHQPRLVTTETVAVSNPEDSQVFYDELKGKPRIYRLASKVPFNLSVAVLVPKTSNSEGRYSLAIYHVNKMREKVGGINANKIEWQDFHEPFVNEYYLQGSKFNKQLHPGTYEIWIFGEHDRGKYALVVGDKEKNSFRSVIEEIPLLLELKRNFFNESTATFAWSIIGGLYFVSFLLIGALIAFLCHLIYWLGMKLKFIKYRSLTNLNLTGRSLRLLIAIACLLIGFDVWYPILFVIAGFMMYEGVAGWCLLEDLFF